MQKSEPSKERQTVLILVAMSFFVGVFISYYISYISAVFVKVAGVDNLPFAYIVSGIGGTLITRWFNTLEIRFSFERVTVLIVSLIAGSILLVWYACKEYGQIPAVIFFSYAWFWITGNFILLVFWKLPGKILSFGQNKRLNGIISSGEVVSAILAYLSVPLLLSQGIIVHESNLLLISFAGLLAFLLVFSLLRFWYSTVLEQAVKTTVIQDPIQPKETFQGLMRTPFFRLLFFSVLTAVVVQSTVDYTVMVVTKEVIKDTRSMASFFGLLFGCAKVIELLLKTTISNVLLKHYGVQAGLISCSLVVGITTIFGLISHAFGALTFLFIASLVNKVMERSLVRSVNSPAINILFQVYTGKLKGIAQNYGDGYGKTYGQLVSGLLLFLISMFYAFNIKVACLNTLILSCSGVLFYLSYRLVPLYKESLKVRIAQMIQGNGLPKKQEKAAENDLRSVIITGINKERAIASNTNSIPEPIKISGVESLAQLTVAASRALALHPTNEKIAALGIQMDGLSKEAWSGINPSVQVYWLMIPAFYLRTRKHFSEYPFEKLEMLVRETDSFFRAHRYERPEAQMAMVTLRALLYEKITKANSEKHVTLLMKEDSEMLSSLLPIMGQSEHQLVSKDIHYYNLLQQFLDTYCQTLSIQNTLQHQDCPLLQRSIRQETEIRLGHVFHILALVHDQEIIDNVRTLMASQNSEDQIIALEILELILDDQEKGWLMPIYQESTPTAVLKKLDRFFPAAIRTFPNTLEYLVSLSPAKMDLEPRYLALEALCDNGTLRYRQVVAACFSKEPLLRFRAHIALQQHYQADYSSVAQQTGFVVPAESAEKKVIQGIEELMALDVPNYVKSKLLLCVSPDLQGTAPLTVTDFSLLGMILAHYNAYSEQIEQALFPSEQTQTSNYHPEILV